MREIKRRKTSIQSTAQITKAMKLVSTVKFQKAKVKAETTRPYFDKMYETVSSILSRSGNIHHRYLMQGESQKKAVIVITSNRGLAGGYNSNVEKAVTSVGFNPADVQLYTVGSKGRDNLSKKGYAVAKDYGDVLEDIAKKLMRSYDVEIEVADSLKNKRFYGSFKIMGNTIDEVLQTIASTNRMKYRHEDEKYILY